MPPTATPAYAGIPSYLNGLRQEHGSDWHAIGANFLNSVSQHQSDDFNPDPWIGGLHSALQFVEVTDPATSCTIIRNWLNANFPDLLASLNEEQAAAFIEGMEGEL